MYNADNENENKKLNIPKMILIWLLPNYKQIFGSDVSVK